MSWASCRDVAEKYFSKLGHYPEDGKLYIACICVRKEMRGQKIGVILLRSIINEFPESTIGLDVLPDNEAAVRLYRKCGFTVTEEGDGDSYRGRQTALSDDVKESPERGNGSSGKLLTAERKLRGKPEWISIMK